MKRHRIVQTDIRSSGLVQSLFSSLVPPQLHPDAVIQRDAAGTVYTDCSERPEAACILAGDACYLVGTPRDSVFFDRVNALLPRDRYAAVFADAGIPAAGLARATRGLYMLPAQRRAAFLHRPPAGGLPVPDGIGLVSIDRPLLDGDAPGTDAVRAEVVDEWQTVGAFLDRGFGIAAVSDGRVVAHSIANYIARGMCEIGVRVTSDCRRRGLGTAVAAATARAAFAHGLETIIWHSWASNVGSIRISRRLGFGDAVFYSVLINHWAAENMSDMSQDEFRSFGEAYERLFADRPPTESGYPYVVAATAFALARDRQACLRNLHRAIDMGWLASERQLRELWPELFSDPTLRERVPEWGALFARLGSVE